MQLRLKNKTFSIFNNLLDKWVEKVGFETIVIYVPQFLKTENADIRTEILKFFDKYKNKFNKNLAENVFKDMENNSVLWSYKKNRIKHKF